MSSGEGVGGAPNFEDALRDHCRNRLGALCQEGASSGFRAFDIGLVEGIDTQDLAHHGDGVLPQHQLLSESPADGDFLGRCVGRLGDEPGDD